MRGMKRASWALVLLVACGSSQAAGAGPEHPSAAGPSVRAVPSDGLELVVGDASAVAIVRVDLVRESPLFARLRPLIETQLCLSAAQLDALLANTSRAIVASRTTQDRVEWLAVLAGQYTEQDADRMLASAARSAEGTAVKQRSGRFTLATQGEVAASLLEQRMLVLGTPTWLHSVLDSLDHAAPSFTASTLWRELSTRVQCAERTGCLLSSAQSIAAQHLKRALSSTGAKALGRQLEAADSAFGVSIPDGVEVAYSARLPTADSAAAAAQQTKDLFWQAGLLIRLAGLPDVLDAAQLSAAGNQLSLQLSVSASDLAQYQERLGKLLEGSTGDCPVEAPVASP
jgi:hypothetical protein